MRTRSWSCLALGLLLAGPELVGVVAQDLPNANQPALRTTARQDAWVTDGPVHAAVETNGVVYLGGSFRYLRPNRGTGVALNLDSQEPDPQFPQINGTVHAAVSDGSGGFYLGGEFTGVGGISRTNLAHILADKSVNPNWQPAADGPVLALALDGRTVFAGGTFGAVNGQSRAGLVALDAIQGEPTSWQPPLSANGAVTALAVALNQVFVIGAFSSIGGQARAGLAALDRATGLATSWNPNPVGGLARAVVVSGDNVYVGGTFTGIGGQLRQRIAAVDRVTGLATDWDPAGPNASITAVNTFVVESGIVFAGGEFAIIGGQPREGLAALDAQTGLATGWNVGLSGTPAPIVTRLAAAEKRLYVAGAFTRAGVDERAGLAAFDTETAAALPWTLEHTGDVLTLATSLHTVFAGGPVLNNAGLRRNNLAALDARTGQPTDWNPDLDGEVFALAASADRIYVGGAFNHVGGQAHTNLVALDRATGNAVNTWTANTDRPVRALALGPNAGLFVGGEFTVVGDQSRLRLALIFGDGLVTSWNPQVNGTVRTLAVGGTAVFAGGDFTSVNQQPRIYTAAVDLNGQITSWAPSVNGPVHTLLPAGQRFYLGGRFTQLGNQTRRHLATVDAATGVAGAWNPDANGAVLALARFHDSIVAAGEFTLLGGQERRHVAQINSDTGAVLPWNPEFDHSADTVVALGDIVFAGGQQEKVGGLMRTHLALFPLEGAPLIVRQPGSGLLRPGDPSLLHVAAEGHAPLFFQWRLNNIDLPGATNDTLAVGSDAANPVRRYSVTVSNALGRVASDGAVVTALLPPVINIQPSGSVATVGGNVTLAILATASPAPTYHWRRNGVAVPSGIGPTLTLRNVTPRDAGRYSVILQNPGGAVLSQVAPVTVAAPVYPFSDNFAQRVSTNAPAGTYVGNNNQATIEDGEPRHAGLPGSKSIWMGWRCPSTGVATFSTLGSGCDTLLAVYTSGPQDPWVAVASDDDRGGFRTSRVMFNATAGVEYLVAIDGLGGDSGDIVLNWDLLANVAPMPMIRVQPLSQAVLLGSNVTLSVQAESQSALTYQWFQGPYRIPGATSPVLTIPAVDEDDVGEYRVRIGNASPFPSDSLPVSVQLGPLLSALVFGKIDYLSGGPSVGVVPGGIERLGFENLGGEPAPSVGPCSTVLYSTMFKQYHATEPGAYMIHTAGSEIRTVVAVTTNATTNAFELPIEVACGITNAPNGFDSEVKFIAQPGIIYTVSVDGLNGASGHIELIVSFCSAPRVSAQRRPGFSPVVRDGDELILGVESSGGMCDTRYQWLRDGVAIAGANHASYTNDAAAGLGATYSIVVTNCVGSVTQRVATLIRLQVNRSEPPGLSEYHLAATPNQIASAYVIESANDPEVWTPLFTNVPNAVLRLPLLPSAEFPARLFRVSPAPP